MFHAAINLRPNGSMTVPKEWRDRFPTMQFMAIETEEGLLLKPILDVEYYEHADGSFGLKFPMGIEAGELHKLIKTANRVIDREEKRQKKPKKSKKHG